MNKKIFNKAIDRIEPDDFMKTRIKKKVLSSHKTKYAGAFIASIACCLVVALFICNLPQDDLTVTYTPATTTQSESITDIEPLVNNEFKLLACTCDNKMSSIKAGKAPEITKEIVLNESEVVLPELKINRRQYSEDNYGGEFHRGYNAGISGDGFFKVKGKNIKCIKYTSLNGEFMIDNIGKYHKLMDDGKYYLLVIPVDENIGWNSYEEFKKLWNDGSLDGYKEKYFKNKSTDLKDYSIGYSTSSSPKTYKVNNEEIYVDANQKAFNITYTDIHDDLFYINKSVTIPYIEKYDRYNYIHIMYQPKNAMDEVEKYQPLKYEDLPGDIITVEVTFENGEVQKKTIETSFNEKGEIKMKLID